MITFEIALMLIFFSFVGAYILKERREIEFKHGIVVRRWRSKIKNIDEFVRKNKKFLKIVGIIGIFVSVCFSIYGFYSLILSILEKKAAVGLLVPTVHGIALPRPLIGIEFWYWLPSIFILLIVHESMHAIFARYADIKIKDYGIILFFLLPIGAFVNIDDKEVKKLKLGKKLAIYSAGSFGNLLIAAIVIGLIFISGRIFDFLIEPIGIEYEIIENTSAEHSGLRGMIIEIDGKRIKTISDLSEILAKKKPGDKIKIKTNISTFDLILQPSPKNKSLPFIGIENVRSVFVNKMNGKIISQKIINFLVSYSDLLFWIFTLNFGVGIANLLPIKIFDGGHIYEEILKKLLGKNLGKSITNLLTTFTLLLILTNILLAFV